MLSSELSEIPEDYLCPITHDLMENPVVAADGHTYEKAAIVRWLEIGHRNSPLTGEKLVHTNLTENHRLKTIIKSFKDSLPYLQRERQIQTDLDEAIKLREEMVKHDLEKRDNEIKDYQMALEKERQEKLFLQQELNLMKKSQEYAQKDNQNSDSIITDFTNHINNMNKRFDEFVELQKNLSSED